MTRLSAPDSLASKEACENAFIVVVHDFASPFHKQLNEICSHLKPLLGWSFAVGYVPSWHDAPNANLEPLLPLAMGCKEVVLHGCSHQREVGSSLLSWVCNRSDEFSGVSVTEVSKRLNRAWRIAADQLGEAKAKHVIGVLPPAYQFPRTDRFFADSQNGDFSYVLRFSRIDFRGGVSIPINTWSYDWGRFSSAGWAGKLAAQSQALIREAIPCLAVHPVDLQRGWFCDAVKQIRRWLQEGRQPITPSDLLIKSAQPAEGLFPEVCRPIE